MSSIENGGGHTTESHERSRKQRTAIVVLSVLLSLSIVYGVLVALVHHGGLFTDVEGRRHSIAHLYPDTCTTDTCIVAAGHLLTSLDATQDPCDDFYAYACANWKLHHPLAGRGSYEGTGIILDFVDAKLKYLLEQKDTPKEAGGIFKMKTFYESCMSTMTDESYDTSPIQNILAAYRYWPIALPSNDTNLEVTMAALEHIGVTAFFYLAIALDDDTGINHLMVTPSEIAKDAEHFYDDYAVNVKDYTTIIEDIYTEFGVDVDTDREHIGDVIEFTDKLFKIQYREGEYIGTTRFNDSNMEEISKRFDWSAYFSEALRLSGAGPYDRSTAVYVDTSNLLYFERLFALLGNTPDRVIKNYLIMNMIVKYTLYLDSSYFERSEEDKIHWKFCLSKTKEYFRHDLNYLLINHTIGFDTKTKVKGMVSNIKAKVIKLIYEKEWVDEDSKLKIIDKIRNIKENIITPDYYSIVKNLNEYSKNVIIKKESYILNLFRLNKAEFNRKFSKYNTKLTGHGWEDDLFEINASYDVYENYISIGTGWFHGTNYNKDYPAYLNYAATGETIGHELSHSVDPSSIRVDKNGNETSDWLPKEFYSAYDERASCFVRQYNGYRIVDRLYDEQVNGSLTLNENIADATGVKASFQAYTSLSADSDLPLPGLNLTIPQLFFVQYAQFYCGDMLPSNRGNDYIHTPNIQRVRGFIQNSKEFAETFKCSADSKMNRKDKCLLW